MIESKRREIVEAGAGCGKTYGLVARYLEGLGVDAETGRRLKNTVSLRPQEILAVTFTEDAAAQMKDRILARLEFFGLNDLKTEVSQRSQISTFHSLCYRLLKNHLPLLGYASAESGTALSPPAVARTLRQKHIKNYLSKSPEAAKYLRRLDFSELAHLGADLWFSSTRPERALVECDAVLTASKTSFQRFQQWTLLHCQDLQTSQPKLTEKSWLPAFIEKLQDPHSKTELQFRSGRELSKKEPELLLLAQSYRDFLKKHLEESISEESLKSESQAQAELLEFFAGAVKIGPRILDFSALESEILRLSDELAKNEKNLLPVAPRLLLVDEFQDTNASQFLILERLSDASTDWYFVGDPKQSIYAFRGADVSLFLKLRSQLTLKSLDTNWRSVAPLLDFVNLVQENLFAEGTKGSTFDPPPQSLKSAKSEEVSGASVKITECPKDYNPMAELLLDLKIAVNDFGPQSSHAFLFSSWKELHRVAKQLEENQVVFEIAGSESTLEHPLTFIFCHYLQWLHEPAKNLLAAQTLQKWSALSQGLETPPLELLREEDLLELRSKMGWQAEGPLTANSSWEEVLKTFCRSIDPLYWPKGREWVSVTERLLSEIEGSTRDFSLSELAELLRFSYRELEGSRVYANAESSRALKLLTIHGSKGLEFDSVFLPELYEKSRRSLQGLIDDDESTALALKFTDRHGRVRQSLYFEKKKRDRQLVEEAEQRRLFYVALTRAKKRLHLYLHTSERESQVKADAFSLFGWPRRMPTYWNLLLLQLKRGGILRELEEKKIVSWREITLTTETDVRPESAIEDEPLREAPL